MENSKTKVIELIITPELCDKHNYTDNYNCPIAVASKAAGLVCPCVCTFSVVDRTGYWSMKPWFMARDYRKIKRSREPMKILLIQRF